MEEGGVGGGNFDPPQGGQIPEPEAPHFIVAVISYIGYIITSYGWPCLFLGALCIYLKSKYSPAIDEWRRRKEEEKESAMYHKNPDMFLAREAALEKARQRLQEKYEQQAKEFAEKQKAKENQKQKDKVAAYDAQLKGEGQRKLQASGSSQTEEKAEKKKPALREDFFPLMGGGGSCGYRPARRSGRSGG